MLPVLADPLGAIVPDWGVAAIALAVIGLIGLWHVFKVLLSGRS